MFSSCGLKRFAFCFLRQLKSATECAELQSVRSRALLEMTEAKQAGETIYIVDFFKEVDDKDISLDVNSSTTIAIQLAQSDPSIADLKEQLQTAKGYDSAKQRLLFLRLGTSKQAKPCTCKPLEDLRDRRFSEYGLASGSWLLLKEAKRISVPKEAVDALDALEAKQREEQAVLDAEADDAASAADDLAAGGSASDSASNSRAHGDDDGYYDLPEGEGDYDDAEGDYFGEADSSENGTSDPLAFDYNSVASASVSNSASVNASASDSAACAKSNS